MKKITVTLSMLLITTSGFTQGLYFRGAAGYALPHAGQTLDGGSAPYSGSLNVATQAYTMKNVSFTSGLQLNGAIGYMFTERAGFELNMVSVLKPREHSCDITNVAINSVPNDLVVTQQASTPSFILPSFVLTTVDRGLNAYTRLGLAIPVRTDIVQHQVFTNQPGTGANTVYDFTIRVKNSFALGFGAAAGVSYKLDNAISLFAEISLLSIAPNIKQTEITDFTRNGTALSLSNISSPLVTNYSNDVVIDSNGFNQPTYAQPFSNVGINIGISVRLSHAANRRQPNEAVVPARNRKPVKF